VTALSQTDDTALPPCPECSATYTWKDVGRLVCPECGHEWLPDAGAGTRDSAAVPSGADDAPVVRDAHGNVLADGDTVTLIKDLKIKGSSAVIKVGTRVRGIRLVQGDHDIDCRIEGIGPMQLKSGFVKKA